jgi:hypothetical protein
MPPFVIVLKAPPMPSKWRVRLRMPLPLMTPRSTPSETSGRLLKPDAVVSLSENM